MTDPLQHPLNKLALELLKQKHPELVGLWGLPVIALAVAGLDEDAPELEPLAELGVMPRRAMKLLEGLTPEELVEDRSPEAMSDQILSHLLPDRRSLLAA